MRPKKKTLLAVSPDCHHRIKMEAARQGVHVQDLASAAFDYVLPLLENGKLAIPQSALQAPLQAFKKEGGPA